MPRDNLELELDHHVDNILDVLEQGAAEGIELDPMASIMRRLQARGQDLNMDEMPPLMRMILGGMQAT